MSLRLLKPKEQSSSGQNAPKPVPKWKTRFLNSVKSLVLLRKNRHSLPSGPSTVSLAEKASSDCDFKLAIDFWTRVIGEGGDDYDMANAHAERGVAYVGLSRPYPPVEKAEYRRLALADLDKALAISPGYAKAHNWRGEVLVHFHKYDLAESDFKHAIRLNPAHPEPHLNLAKVLHKRHDLENALISVNKALEVSSIYGSAYMERGLIYQNMHKHEQAIEDFNTALFMNPHNSDPNVWIANSLFLMGRRKEAFVQYGTAIHNAPRNSYGYFHRGKAHFRCKDFERAEKDFSAAIGLFKSFVDAHIWLGKTQGKLRKTISAIKSLNTAISFAPKNAEARHILGVIHLHMKETALAMENLKIARGLCSYDGILVDYSNAKIDAGIADSVLEDVNKVISSNPEHVAALYVRGKYYLLQKQYDEAEHDLLLSTLLCPLWSNSWDAIYDLYHKVGNVPKSEWAYSRRVLSFLDGHKIPTDEIKAVENAAYRPKYDVGMDEYWLTIPREFFVSRPRAQRMPRG